MQAVLWFTDSLKLKATLEEHSSLITDVRFSPSASRLATSSFDKTVRVWDVENVSMFVSLFTLNSILFFRSNFYGLYFYFGLVSFKGYYVYMNLPC